MQWQLGEGNAVDASTHLTRLCKRVIDIEEEYRVLERSLVERGVDGCCESHDVFLFAYS
jgi:hypothetical protein